MKMNIRNVQKYFGYAFAAASILILSGCVSHDTSDLEAWTQKVLARPGGRIKPLPAIKPYEAYTYKGADEHKRDPFEPFYQLRMAKEKDNGDSGLTAAQEREIKDRHREELEQFELDSLKMVGTMKDKNEQWAIILDPDGVVHRVKVGNYMGRNIGKITNISEDQIKLREIIKTSQGVWKERKASIALDTSSGGKKS
jgi:type IV pilus assembly protein PilP